ncbi:acetylornithine deacetylase [Rhodobium gokarnense]|uniref:Acetylornithine deacetylase n=1 Tax=Rhodobium gokarnense TaxID=364296 RepID=A0ABT3H9G5_9HYPH|nr:acetylornithine deacetylase [Rhodobium gokarnense]MCW2306974.1 acetylornithine deacetylase [Rhodobium gokarnense]
MTLIDDTRDILRDLIAFPTVSADSNLELIAYAADHLGALGARTSVILDETGHKANLIASLGPEEDGGIALSGHSDVVPVADQDWSSDPFELREENGRLYGRGTCDMKGFIAASLAVAPLFAERPLSRPLHFIFTYDEEVGCLGARHLVDEMGRMDTKPSVVIIGEPTEMRIVEGHKGCCEYTTTFTGLEGHGSMPDHGVNAVEYAVRYVAKLMELREDMKCWAPAGSRFDPPWTSLQVGRIAGGVAHNVIPGLCTVDWEMRPVRAEDRVRLRAAIDAYVSDTLLPDMRAVSPEADILTHVIGEVVGLEPADDNEALRIVSELTGSNEADVIAFGTEAGLFQELGMSAVVCGPGSVEQAHKPDEFVTLDQLESCLAMLRGLEERLIA